MHLQRVLSDRLRPHRVEHTDNADARLARERLKTGGNLLIGGNEIGAGEWTFEQNAGVITSQVEAELSVLHPDQIGAPGDLPVSRDLQVTRRLLIPRPDDPHRIGDRRRRGRRLHHAFVMHEHRGHRRAEVGTGQRHSPGGTGRPVVVLPGRVIDARTTTDQGEELLSKLGAVRQLDLIGVQRDLEVFIEIGAGLLADDIIDLAIGKVAPECLTGIRITVYGLHPIAGAGDREPSYCESWVKRNRLALINDEIDDDLAAVPMRDRECRIVAAAAAHVAKGGVVDAFLRPKRLAPGNDGALDDTLIEESALRSTRQIVVQAAKARRRKAAALPRKIVETFRPRPPARICTLIRRQMREVRISAEVSTIPGEQHSRIGAADTDLLEIVKRCALEIEQAVVTCDPRQAVPRRVRRQRLEEGVVLVGMDLIEADEGGRLAVLAGDVLRRQNPHRTATVTTPDLVLKNDQLTVEGVVEAVGNDDLLGKV
ncbi:hypothetical protein BJS_08715 [Bradyrhizobium japonicum SEMIA 5079]|nr:hypothetical protein BJS_08715 [Bradyrhizobium japonicum SEMIA 5079]